MGLWWLPISAGIWIFVALTLPLLIALFDKPATQEEALENIRMCWAWPVLLCLAAIVLPIMGIAEAVKWLGTGYISVMVKPGAESQPLEGKVVE